MQMSRSSDVDMHNRFLVWALALVHMGLGPDHEGQEQCHYAQQNLDHFPHPARLYQNNRPCVRGAVKDRLRDHRYAGCDVLSRIGSHDMEYAQVSSAFRCPLPNGLTILGYSITKPMAHTSKDKEKLLSRVRRIRGQVDAIEKALDSEQECAGVLQLMAACRGALNGLMAEVMEGHVRFHVLSPENGKNSPQALAAEELIDVVRAYLK